MILHNTLSTCHGRACAQPPGCRVANFSRYELAAFYRRYSVHYYQLVVSISLFDVEYRLSQYYTFNRPGYSVNRSLSICLLDVVIVLICSSLQTCSWSCTCISFGISVCACFLPVCIPVMLQHAALSDVFHTVPLTNCVILRSTQLCRERSTLVDQSVSHGRNRL